MKKLFITLLGFLLLVNFGNIYNNVLNVNDDVSSKIYLSKIVKSERLGLIDGKADSYI
ncbi:hypothetical protein SITYG_16680 [Streptococcus intermedius]|uniref:Uncharacterized protein n=1 Tax=Streptococcus intermedius TaxID=1338 RepID=A0AAD1C8W9_STRIT|nr:hypothetical protein [Streptococcus intermedius]BAW17647.1 hypothetical protein SITYG_16680 [Streptococcus intermedius]